MKTITLFLLFGLSVSAFSQGKLQTDNIRYTVVPSPWNEQIRETDPNSNKGEFQPTGPNLLGKHRALISVSQSGPVARLDLEWRRHDKDVARNRFIIVSKQTGDTIRNIYRLEINNEHCDILFGPVTAGEYYFYYLPFYLWIPDGDRGGYMKDYSVMEPPLDESWLAINQIKSGNPGRFIKASCLEIQARTEFDSFYPMEVIATEKEKKALIAKHSGEKFLLFPMDRKFPVRMLDNIPQQWVLNPISHKFQGTACKNEYYAFQIGVWALENLENLQIDFKPLKGESYTLPVTAMTCLNTGGIDPAGKEFTKTVNVTNGRVQALWVGLDLPKNIPAGEYKGKLIVKTNQAGQKEIDVAIKITDEILMDRGDGEPWRHSRLRWLNSTAGLEDIPAQPYDPIQLVNDKLVLSGKEVSLSSSGLPSSIKVFGEEVLAGPVQFNLEKNGSKMTFQSGNKKVIKQAKTLYSQEVSQKNEFIEVITHTEVEPDGWMKYTFDVRILRDQEVSDIQLRIPYTRESSAYLSGMNLFGVKTPDNHEAKWDSIYDAFWIGSTKGGLYCELRGAPYCGPMVYYPPLYDYYHFSLPEAWYNKSKGGFRISSVNLQRDAIVYSGPRALKKGEILKFECSFIITPIKKLDTKYHFANRYYHNPYDPEPKESDAALGVNVANIHHGTDWLPYINSPFTGRKELKGYVDRCHEKGIKAKIYYTTREISNFVPEIWAFRSMGDEIVMMGGSGGGYQWLKEHYVDNYYPQWYHIFHENIWEVDAAVQSSVGKNRWHNYYIEDIKWLMQNVGIDGIYIDASLYDRETIKRVKTVMDQVKPGSLIDLHEGKNSILKYLEFFPYIDKPWFGEGVIYNDMEPSDWLVSLSGIPFGLMGEMLNMGGNPWRGMVYGMTNRYGWTTYDIFCDPTNIWKLWDSFGIGESKMVGYWEDKPVVTTSNKDVLATAYLRNKKMLVSIASWAKNTTEIKLNIDFNLAGLNPDKIKITAPVIKDFQPGKEFRLNETITVEPAKGWLLIIEEK